MERFIAWGNFRGVEITDGSGVHMNNFVAADNEHSGLAAKETTTDDNFENDSTAFVNATLIGHSDSHSTRTSCVSFGFETPWKFGSFQV